MKNYLQIFFLLLIMLCIASVGFAKSDKEKGPEFYYDFSAMVNPLNFDETRLTVYIQVRFDDLQFVKVDKGFEAKYEVSVVLYDKDDDQEAGKIWQETVFVEHFDQTNIRAQFNTTFAAFDVPPGKYTALVMLQDVETELSRAFKNKLKLEKFNKKKISASDIVFTKQVVIDSLGIKQITPQLTNAFKGLSGHPHAYFEIYNTEKYDKADVVYEIQGAKTKQILTDTAFVKLTGFRSLAVVPIPIDSLGHDKYTLTLNIVGDGKKKTKVSKDFYIRWKGIPNTAEDLDVAIEQTRFVATPAAFKRLKSTPKEQRLEEFKKFWKANDPSPGTDINEAMEAYYNRIDYANQEFTVMKREGWRTDRGMIYIILGNPDELYRNPYPSDSNPYQIWTYYRFNLEFLFYDETGFGDYRLATPYSIYELQRYLR